MISTPQKEVIRSFFGKISQSDFNGAFLLVDDNVTWWIPEELPFSGIKTKTQYFQIVQRIQAGFPTGFEMTVAGLVQEGNKIAAEVQSKGMHVNGRLYNNKYHFLFVVESGLITSVMEYMNTLHLALLLGTHQQM